MKRIAVAALLIQLSFASLAALTIPAEVVGAKVWVLEYQLKMAQSAPMAHAAVDAELDLTEGIGNTLDNPLEFETVDAEAVELSISFDNSYIHLKAYAFDEGSAIYYYTTAAGVATSATDPTLASDFDFLDIGEILPGDSDGRITPQSPFPEPVLIEAGSSHTIHGRVNLEYAVMFWDGNGLPSGNASWTGAVFTDPEPTFAVADLDVVLAMDREVESEVYLFAESSAALTGEDILTTKAVAVFFDDNGNLHDGAAKTATGYDVNSGPTRLGSWKRFGSTSPDPDGTIPFAVAIGYDTAAGQYYYQYPTRGFERVAESEIDVEHTFTITLDGAAETVYYKRVE